MFSNLYTYGRRMAWIATFSLLFSCQNNELEKNEREMYKEKIMNQRIMLDDALKQLKYEKKEVKLLKKQLKISENQTEKDISGLSSRDSIMQQFGQLRQQVNYWQKSLEDKERQYRKVKSELDKTLDYLSENQITVVRNRLNEIQGIKLAKVQKKQNNSDNSARFDSLMTVLERERALAKRSERKYERMISYYQRELKELQDAINNQGVFFNEYKSNFKVYLSASNKNTGQATFDLKITREVGRPRKLVMNVRLICKQPDGNPAELYDGKVTFGRKDETITIKNIKPFSITVKGEHQLSVKMKGENHSEKDFVKLFSKSWKFN